MAEQEVQVVEDVQDVVEKKISPADMGDQALLDAIQDARNNSATKGEELPDLRKELEGRRLLYAGEIIGREIRDLSELTIDDLDVIKKWINKPGQGATAITTSLLK
ncbi:hypothetical protein KA017_03985 [Candidatus Woesebacteria bacterium]|nr:hypothetical protein [Candidatus Woesebacteria bacterium]